jgi:glycyl-tRNA synthetase beta chain
MPSADLLFELGLEELPASYASRAVDQLGQLAQTRLAEARLEIKDPAAITTAGTPRRLALMVRGLADRQTDVSERVVGPPVSAAFAKDGTPTKAALGFASKNGVDVSALERVEVPGKKGQYVACLRAETGRPAMEVLPGLLSGLVRDLSWPKQMRWGWLEDSYPRPVHWLVALYGGEVLPVSFAGVKAGRFSRGHRFLASGPIELEGDLDGYLKALRRGFVIADPRSRRDSVVGELRRLERETGATVREDDSLVEEVTFLVEYPVGICGQFDPGFLEVPEEVVVSAMRSHQRYFAMQGADGKIVNRFATIAGTVTRDADLVRQGNERVLAARLADARFFFTEDCKKTLEQWAEQLNSVVFQADLGSIGAKVERVRQIAARIPGADAQQVSRAISLCKADLVTHMVGEFPDLQGVMGGHYARLGGEQEAVCQAIPDHYLPKAAGDQLPRGDVGAVVAVADRIDTITGCFAVGLAPTGSADPYALRRAALGVLAILLDRGWSVELTDLVSWSAQAHEVEVPAADVLEFFRVRLRGLLVEGRNLPADCVDAALATGFSNVPDAAARADAVAQLRSRDDFQVLATAFKRVANILKGQSTAAAPDPARFSDGSERALWAAFTDVSARVDQQLSARDYKGALTVIADLKQPVDDFFEQVLVMDKDEAVRTNRIALLATINATFTRIADFRQLAV